MGAPTENDGSIERVDLDGGNRTTIVPSGVTHTPKQLYLEAVGRKLYWGDREDPPRGNSMNRSPLDPPHGQRMPEILLTHLMEGIGVALDPDGGRMYVTDLAGNVYAADLDASNQREILILQGNLTGIARAVLTGTRG
ncbi:hypothetical protein [Streptomyces sp. NBC_00996]|uniref:hypothetical protein n=1 Tax=Streptomyces sp. NBC_00996 TaxID=2903710 RepID=UPI00386FF202|nr:hypothetical protein OG390_36480 [Streptomyces sp. NBC_00996]